MRFSSLTRAANRTAAACSLQKQAGAPAGQAAQSAVQRSPPSVTHIMGYYLFNRPRRDGRLSWPCWLSDSGRCTHKVVKQPSISLAQDKESPPARTDVLPLCYATKLLGFGPSLLASATDRTKPAATELRLPSAFVTTQLEKWHSFYLPTEDRRLIWARWLVTHWDGLPAGIQVLTGPAQSNFIDQTQHDTAVPHHLMDNIMFVAFHYKLTAAWENGLEKKIINKKCTVGN